MKDLIERLEKATEGSRELDGLILASLPAPFAAPGRCQMRIAAHWTTSLDAALKLVPEGREWSVMLDDLGYRAVVYDANNAQGEVFEGATPALALTIAALKARSEA